MPYRILVINPGSTSTKVAIFDDKECVISENLRHSSKELSKFVKLWDQFDFRLEAVYKFLLKNNIIISNLDAVVGRGGLLRALEGGTYLVNDQMIQDALQGVQGEHVSNLGCALARAIAERAKCNVYTVDPVSVDEFEPLARYSGHPKIQRRALAHTLNLHEAARRAAQQLGLSYNESNFIVAHLGGGISIAPIKGGRIIDVNDASSSGPFSPERTGELPLQQFIDLCFCGDYEKSEVKKMVMGEGGLKAYLGTYLAEEIEERIINGDQTAREVFQAMAYQIAKEIGAMATVLHGKTQAIVITGGLAKSKRLVDWITESVSFIAPVLVLTGEFEMKALAFGALRVLRGEEAVKTY